MAEILRLFVSATTDLDAQRSVIGRTVADLPVRIGIEIRRTPVEGGKYDDMYELIANCDRVYFLMGRDITAPAGAEWHLAWQLERSIMPLRAPAALTPAGGEFVRGVPLDWVWFRSSTELVRIITRDLIRILRHPANRYGLTLPELELLAERSRSIEALQANAPKEPDGTEGGGILLDPNRNEPIEGVLLDDQ